jgi:hypothetical protein
VVMKSKYTIWDMRCTETSVDTQRNTRHYIPEDGTLQGLSCYKSNEANQKLKQKKTDVPNSSPQVGIVH